MEEITRTYDAYGVTPHFHKGAGDIMELANRTPLAKRTRETTSNEHSLTEILELYISVMKRNDS